MSVVSESQQSQLVPSQTSGRRIGAVRTRSNGQGPTRRSRGWCLTLNNYTEEDRLQILQTPCVYCIVGREVGESGTPHLQGYMYFEHMKSLQQLREINARAHFEAAKGTPLENRNYCSKDGNFEEVGVLPASQAEKGSRGAAQIQLYWQLAKEGKFEQLPPQSIKTWEYIYQKYAPVPPPRSSLMNYWIFGKTGCGKSSFVRKLFGPGELYWKGMNRWWDGYMGESCVVLDDFEPDHGKFLGYYFKIWCDHYPFNAEVKGGMLHIRPGIVIVTSNFRLEECFSDDIIRSAVRRRFTILDFDMFRYEELPIPDAQNNHDRDVVTSNAPVVNIP